MAKKHWRCVKCAYNNNNVACDVGNDKMFMTQEAYTCKEFEREGTYKDEKSNVTPLLPSPQKPKIRFFSDDEVVYALHD